MFKWVMTINASVTNTKNKYIFLNKQFIDRALRSLGVSSQAIIYALEPKKYFSSVYCQRIK